MRPSVLRPPASRLALPTEGSLLPMTGLVLIVVMLGLMWAVVVLPQQRRVKAHQRLCDRIEVGHVVMTTAGLYGTVVQAGDDRLVLEAAPGVQVVVDRRSIGMLVPDGTTLADLADVSRPTPEPVPPAGSSMADRLGLGGSSSTGGPTPSTERTGDAGPDAVDGSDDPAAPSDAVGRPEPAGAAEFAEPAELAEPAVDRVEADS